MAMMEKFVRNTKSDTTKNEKENEEAVVPPYETLAFEENYSVPTEKEGIVFRDGYFEDVEMGVERRDEGNKSVVSKDTAGGRLR